MEIYYQSVPRDEVERFQNEVKNGSRLERRETSSCTNLYSTRDPIVRAVNRVLPPSTPQQPQQVAVAKPESPHRSDSPSVSNPIELPHLSFLTDDIEIEMRCTKVVSPSEFYLQLPFDDTYDKLKSDMQRFYSVSKKTPAKIELNKEYVMLFNDTWTRILVLDAYDSGNLFSCFLLDEGLIGCESPEQIFELDNKFKNIAPQAVKAELAYIQPRGSNGEWSSESIDYFTKWAEEKCVQVILMNYNKDSRCITCNLVLDEENILEELVTKGFGDPAD